MTKQEAAGFIGGFVFTVTEWITGLTVNTYLETALKGLIGGVLGYCGQQLTVWMYKKFKNVIKKTKNKNQTNEKDNLSL